MSKSTRDSRLFTFRLGGVMREWLENKVQSGDQSITDVITEALHFIYIHDRIAKRVVESVQTNMMLTRVFEGKMSSTDFHSIYALKIERDVTIDQLFEDEVQFTERLSGKRFVALKGEGPLDTEPESALYPFIHRYFTSWQGYELRGDGNLLLQLYIDGNEFVYIDTTKCDFFGVTTLQFVRQLDNEYIESSEEP